VMSRSLKNSGLLKWMNENSKHEILKEDPLTTSGRSEGSN